MPRPLSLVTVVALVLASTPAPQAALAKPQLVVLISIDQFRADYVQRYGKSWTQGLHRVVTEGAYFSQAAYPYMNTVTCAGHSTMSTGTFPLTHGMPLNAWWDREAGKQVTCTEDPTAKDITYGKVPSTSVGNSPWRLRVPTFSDELRLQQSPPGHVVALSLKARSALTLAGHGADLATWYDFERGFVTSSAHAPGRNAFLEKFLNDNPLETDAGKTWDRLLPANAYLFSDDAKGEKPIATWTRTFPHVLPGTAGHAAEGFYELWEQTPFADAYLARMAVAAVREYKLGQGPSTDFLAISFSSLDVAGHNFGPRSHEVQDMLLRLDATIGGLLTQLDQVVGKDRYVLAVTGDHGIAPIPEQVAEEGIAAGRISVDTLAARVNAALAPFLGPGVYTQALIYTDFYFKQGVYARLLANPEAMKAVIAAIEATPGVLRALRSDQIEDVHLGADQLAQTALYSYAPGRSGDMLIVPQPYFINSTAASTHGTGYRYDARVPVVLLGPGFKVGEFTSAATPADIVPTLAYAVGITMPRSDGRVLSEALLGGGNDAQRTASQAPARNSALSR